MRPSRCDLPPTAASQRPGARRTVPDPSALRPQRRRNASPVVAFLTPLNASNPDCPQTAAKECARGNLTIFDQGPRPRPFRPRRGVSRPALCRPTSRACTTRRIVARTSRRPASSTRISWACRWCVNQPPDFLGRPLSRPATVAIPAGGWLSCKAALWCCLSVVVDERADLPRSCCLRSRHRGCAASLYGSQSQRVLASNQLEGLSAASVSLAHSLSL